MSLGDTEEITGGRQSFKLTQRGGDRFADAASEPGIAQSLPRADGGKDAWLFLMGGFMIESLVWGELILYLCVDPKGVEFECEVMTHLTTGTRIEEQLL